ncbi:hypothetical protein PoB_002995700 [Plakobranchus ocellatus]|uniref:Uncharacterized protein n=1 Tax=Plakobranchus ocellatus TaxID=259542 RepID=A0AAV4A919_9GAST|nr:hypothetical protein PoB_002995700 [Plakobranchus ocellatus]
MIYQPVDLPVMSQDGPSEIINLTLGIEDPVMEDIQFLQEPSASPTGPISLNTSATNSVVELMDGSDISIEDFNRSRVQQEISSRNVGQKYPKSGSSEWKRIFVNRSNKTVLERAIRPKCTSNFCVKSALRHCSTFCKDERAAILPSFGRCHPGLRK